MPFLINGSTASLAPYSMRWAKIPMGQDHNGNTIYSGFMNCEMQFDNSAPAMYNQWQALCNTGTSIQSITLLNQDASSYTTYSNSGISLQMTTPNFESAYITGWTITANGIQP